LLATWQKRIAAFGAFENYSKRQEWASKPPFFERGRSADIVEKRFWREVCATLIPHGAPDGHNDSSYRDFRLRNCVATSTLGVFQQYPPLLAVRKVWSVCD
jgi:hypothetical protein